MRTPAPPEGSHRSTTLLATTTSGAGLFQEPAPDAVFSSCNRSPRPPAAGRGRLLRDDLAPWPAQTPGKGPARAARHDPFPLLFDNSVVGHTRIQVRVANLRLRTRRSGDGRGIHTTSPCKPHDASYDSFTIRGSGILHNTVSRRIDETSTRRQNDTNPLGIGSQGPRAVAASRDAGIARLGARKQPAGRFRGLPRRRRPDRRGQAPKGAGGMPRRHQQFERGRLRYVRGSCPTSVDPGILEENPGN